MENMNDVEKMSLVDILTQGVELSTQLKNQMNPLTSKETCEHLIQKILSTYDQAMACLNLTELLKSGPSPMSSLVESSNGVTPKIGYARGHSHRGVFKKRNTLPLRSEQVKVCSRTGLEGPLDGHSWRKYGQKNILGATHPRAYYRCTHKYTRGCVATKQVQKTEQDPSIFVVTYRGNHTCMDALNSCSPVVSLDEKSKEIINNLHQNPEPKQVQNLPFEFGQCLKVETEEIKSKVVGRVSSPSFPSTSTQTDNQDIWEQLEDNILARLISPATSETNYFCGSTCQVLPYPNSIRSDISDMVSTPTSGMNSLFNLHLDTIEPNLSFDVLDYFTTSV